LLPLQIRHMDCGCAVSMARMLAIRRAFGEVARRNRLIGNECRNVGQHVVLPRLGNSQALHQSLLIVRLDRVHEAQLVLGARAGEHVDGANALLQRGASTSARTTCRQERALPGLLGRPSGKSSPTQSKWSLMLPSSARIGFVLPKMGRSFFLCPILNSFIERARAGKAVTSRTARAANRPHPRSARIRGQSRAGDNASPGDS
jgi:hypothetical protein